MGTSRRADSTCRGTGTRTGSRAGGFTCNARLLLEKPDRVSSRGGYYVAIDGASVRVSARASLAVRLGRREGILELEQSQAAVGAAADDAAGPVKVAAHRALPLVRFDGVQRELTASVPELHGAVVGARYELMLVARAPAHGDDHALSSRGRWGEERVRWVFQFGSLFGFWFLVFVFWFSSLSRIRGRFGGWFAGVSGKN